MPTDFRSTSGGDGIVIADIFQSSVIEVTFDPPSLDTGSSATSSPITVDGVKVGDVVDLFPPYNTQGVIYQASVSDENQITINLFNASSETVDLDSGTWGIAIKRRA